jgi:uncharacterized membrane protein YgdD (TMEM256/DUF423 family)
MGRKSWLKLGACLAGISVIVLALAAHWLENRLTADRLQSIETAAQLQFMHALAMLILSYPHNGSIVEGSRKATLWLMFLGAMLFSGSIYLLSMRELAGIEWARLLWPLTPLGGILLIISWIVLAMEKHK